MTVTASDPLDGTLRQSLRLLATRRFGTFWFASLLSNIGTWAQQVAQPWLLLSLGASPMLLGLDAFAMGAPVLLLTLVGGVLADRGDRRRIIATFQSIQMLCPLLIVVLILTGFVQPWMVVLTSLVVGITDALSMPSFQSIVPSIVEREQIPTGIALNSTQFNLSRILGPAVAGMLMAGIGAAGAYAVNAASYVPFILVALWILPRGARPAVPTSSHDDRFDRHALFAGVREIAGEPVLRNALLTVLTTSSLCVPLITFCPLLVKQVFHGDINHFSLTIGAFGAGGLLGAIALLAVDPRRDRRPLSSGFAVAFGALVALAALVPWFWALPVVFVLAGIAMTASNASANTLLQSVAPARIRGQSVSLFMLAMRGGVSLGGLLTGVTISLLGVGEALLLNGVLAMMAHMALRRAWLRSPLEDIEPPTDDRAR
jgi:MFS family permease